MPRLVALTEGDLDRVVVEQMLQGLDAKVLPDRQTKSKGKDAALRLVDAEVAAGSSRIVLALDLNGGTAEELSAEVKRKLSRMQIRDDPARPDVFFYGSEPSPSMVCLWPMGLPSDPVLGEYEVARHAVEDLIVKALQDPRCLANLASREDKVHIPAARIRGPRSSVSWSLPGRMATP